MKRLRRVFFYTALTISVLLIALIASVFLFKERIIKQFIQEANKQLNTPVKVGKIDVSVFEQFPQISIVLKDVYIEDSHPGQYPLLTAKKVSFIMNPVRVWNGDYTISGLRVEESETNLKLNSKGENNYAVVKKQGGGKKSSVGFELQDVTLVNTKVHYIDLRLIQDFIFTSDKMQASIQSKNDLYDIETTGQLTTDKMLIESQSILAGKSFQINSHLIYDDVNKALTINPSKLIMKNAVFNVTGNYQWKEKNLIDIRTEGEDTDIQTLISLLPESLSGKLDKYQSKGDVYFNAHLQGEISKNKNPVCRSISVLTTPHFFIRNTIQESRRHRSRARSQAGIF